MRGVSGVVLAVFGLLAGASAQTCTNLCLQQVSCPNGGTTSISGTVYTPNGNDPLPNALVYIPNAPVEAFTPGVSCPVPGQAPSGSPLVGTTTAADGTFTLSNVPVGANIPLVVVSGRWRRQVTVPLTTGCANTSFSAQMPSNQSEGDIPKIAIVTGLADQVECVLRKVGVADSEFTDPSGNGRINLYRGDIGPGAQIDASTPDEASLMGDTSTVNQYDLVMLPCQGNNGLPDEPKSADELSNFVSFSNAGGRIYSSHYSYVYMDGNPNQPAVAAWDIDQMQPKPDPGVATVVTSFAEGATLAQWLQLTGASTTEGQMPISTLRHDMDGVIAPTQIWLNLNDTALNNPVMQFVYDAPVGQKTNQCGKVLFNEYHVENPPVSPMGMTFPNECPALGTGLTAQEKLLEYSLFELTNDGGEPTLTPTSVNFGSEPVGFVTGVTTFTWTNNSVFSASAMPATGSANFVVVSNNCASVAAGTSCSIGVVFKPTATGTLTDTLTVTSTGPSTSAALTGVGTPDLSFTSAGLTFGSHDVGSSTTQVLTVTNAASGTVPVPAISTTGDYAATTSCGSTLAEGGSCTISVTFTPATTGDRPGTLVVGSNTPITLDGNGIDFTVAISPETGTVEAGLSIATNATATPIAGFANAVTLTCTSTAPAATCSVQNAAFTPASATSTVVTIVTISEYTVIGYEDGLLWMCGLATGAMLWWRRRELRPSGAGTAARFGLLGALVAVAGLGLSGCSGRLPAKNASYTPAGSYTVTVTATDGFLVHSATYTLKVTN